VGCVYNPNLNECFTAAKGHGAFLNDKPIHVSQIDNLTDSLLATGFPYDLRDSSEDNLVNFALFYKKCQAVRRAGAAALDLAYVACGRFEDSGSLSFRDGYRRRDYSGTRGGGIVSDFTGNPVGITKGEVLASNGIIHPKMIEILKLAKTAQGDFDFQMFFKNFVVQNWDISASKKIDRSLRLIPVTIRYYRLMPESPSGYPRPYPVGRRFDTVADGGETRQSTCIRYRIVIETIKVSTCEYSIQSWIRVKPE
jgi:fructose-1,6-bisphosphatase/inositol monophosphatase family enzyme